MYEWLNEDQEWVATKRQIHSRARALQIPKDINPGMARANLALLDALYADIRIDMSYIEENKEKIDNIIREWERTKIEGANELKRKQAASEAVQNYPINDRETVNLYEVQRELTGKLSFYEGVIDVLEAKQSRMITLSGLMKLESNTSPYQSTD